MNFNLLVTVFYHFNFCLYVVSVICYLLLPLGQDSLGKEVFNLNGTFLAK